MKSSTYADIKTLRFGTRNTDVLVHATLFSNLQLMLTHATVWQIAACHLPGPTVRPPCSQVVVWQPDGDGGHDCASRFGLG